jgi:hypothetical protein
MSLWTGNEYGDGTAISWWKRQAFLKGFHDLTRLVRQVVARSHDTLSGAAIQATFTSPATP